MWRRSLVLLGALTSVAARSHTRGRAAPAPVTAPTAAPALAAPAAGRTAILPLGDSITFGCGSGKALPPQWSVNCDGSCPGYRIPLYHALKDTGFVDASGNASFVMVGTQSAGPPDVPAEQRMHEGHPGWTIPQIINIQKNWIPLNASFILAHIGTNDCGQGHPVAQMLSDMASLLAVIKTGNPSATTIVGSIINMSYNDTRACVVAYNAGLPGVVATAKAAGQSVLFADVNRRSGWCDSPASPNWPCTGVHPTSGGYMGMALAWWEVLAPLMPLPPTPLAPPSATLEQAVAAGAA